MYYVKYKTPFTLKWGITLAGSSLNLADATLRVLLKNARGSVDITEYIADITDNVITLSLVGLNYLGEYSLNLRVQSSSTPTFEVDERYALMVTDSKFATENEEIVINTIVKINDGKLLDDALSMTSINGVQNNVIAYEFASVRKEIEDALSGVAESSNVRFAELEEAVKILEEGVAVEFARVQESLDYALEKIEYLLSKDNPDSPDTPDTPENPDEPENPDDGTSNVLGQAKLGSMILG